MGNRRGESEIGGMVLLAVFAGACYLLFLGGKAIWTTTFGDKADPGCFWLMRNPGFSPCLVDDPGQDLCVSMNHFTAHRLTCGSEAELADFTQKSGRKLCSPVKWRCAPKGPHEVGETRLFNGNIYTRWEDGLWHPTPERAGDLSEQPIDAGTP